MAPLYDIMNDRILEGLDLFLRMGVHDVHKPVNIEHLILMVPHFSHNQGQFPDLILHSRLQLPDFTNTAFAHENRKIAIGNYVG